MWKWSIVIIQLMMLYKHVANCSLYIYGVTLKRNVDFMVQFVRLAIFTVIEIHLFPNSVTLPISFCFHIGISTLICCIIDW